MANCQMCGIVIPDGTTLCQIHSAASPTPYAQPQYGQTTPPATPYSQPQYGQTPPAQPYTDPTYGQTPPAQPYANPYAQSQYSQSQYGQTPYGQTPYNQGYSPVPYGQPMASDVQANKAMAVLSYIGILFLIPLLTGAHKKSPFAKYHLNQGIVLILCSFAYNIVLSILTNIIGSLWGLLSLLYMAPLVLLIIGVVNAVQGQTKPLPLIGNLFTVLK